MDLMTEAFGSNAPDDDAGNDDEDDDDFDEGGDGPSSGDGPDDPDNGSRGDTSLMRALSDALGPLATETSEPEAPEELPAISLWNDETLAGAGTEEVSGTPVTSSDEVPAAAPGTKEVSASSDEVLSGTPGIQEVSEIPGPPSDPASRPDVPTHELAPNVSTEIPMEAPLSREADESSKKPPASVASFSSCSDSPGNHQRFNPAHENKLARLLELKILFHILVQCSLSSLPV